MSKLKDSVTPWSVYVGKLGLGEDVTNEEMIQALTNPKNAPTLLLSEMSQEQLKKVIQASQMAISVAQGDM